jgi:hypothetical protein
MPRGGKPRHVRADLGHDDTGGGFTDAGHRREDLDVFAKRAEVLLHPRFQPANGLVQRIDLSQVELDEEARVIAHANA